MRTHAKGIMGAALMIIALCFLASMSCAWDIVTKGEILTDEDAALEHLRALDLDPTPKVLQGEETDDLPEYMFFKKYSEIVIDYVTYDLVEMEVGEILDGEGGDNDTLFVNLTP